MAVTTIYLVSEYLKTSAARYLVDGELACGRLMAI